MSFEATYGIFYEVFSLPVLLYIMVFGYVGAFLFVGQLKGKKYLSKRSLPRGKTEEKDRFFEGIFQSQNFSLTLAGFALAGLALILSIGKSERTPGFIHLTAFFSMGIFFELFAGMLFSFTTSSRWHPYAGFVLEYGGILCLLSGFFVFLVDVVKPPQLIMIIYISGLVIFLTFRIKRLYKDAHEIWNAA